MSARGAIAALNNLGSATAISVFLASRNIKGNFGSPDSCPVAAYLRDFTTEKHIAVGMNRIVVGETLLATMVWNDPLATFIRKFDAREYPELEA